MLYLESSVKVFLVHGPCTCKRQMRWCFTDSKTNMVSHYHAYTTLPTCIFTLTGVGKRAWRTLRYARCEEGCEFSQPETHLPDMHQPPFPTTTTTTGLVLVQSRLGGTRWTARGSVHVIYSAYSFSTRSTSLFLISDDFQTLRLPQTFYFVFTQCSPRLLFLLVCMVSD